MMQAQAAAKYTKANEINKPFQLHQLQEGNNLGSNNFQIHSKSHKPVEFKKI